MYDGDEVQDEVRQNTRDQMYPDSNAFRLAPTQQVPTLAPEPPVFKPVLGLSQRQVELKFNADVGQPQQGAARERRLRTITADIAAIGRFLPRLEEVRTFLATMPVEDDEDLAEAKRLTDLKVRSFIAEVTAKLESLQQELEIKQPSSIS